MKKTITLDASYDKYAGKVIEELLTVEQIDRRVAELGAEISVKYQGKVPIFIGVLNGSFIFFSDLFRKLTIDGEVDFIKISSYADQTQSTGTVLLRKDISCDITGRDVIIVEDIIDSGLSIKFLKRRLEESNPSTVSFAALLMKEHTQVDFPIDFLGFKIPDKFVVGYGLDVAQKLRNLPSIYAFK
ncbi:MAG: hypoxanthine phosphoribosyltransferase [Candidatus Marinimicrobia bacterium]|nr:hypoxanthine phosphoribosyltransferase [Candidatus Neomarinimicrobiota bacterium]MDD5060839.1 hypoxanthine phosphoribosyltransferase [Candidatus Neomarinimicrobiota bacterium]MDD5230386.1 hypoxanthine phosphoribosyltransferase [Candidatus Neomarinimicrobiota bacterium]MDD5539726.1 hypoxanthine phosphoribosyltransferase [Candidatus Neomarinimicrobiota bacterium]